MRKAVAIAVVAAMFGAGFLSGSQWAGGTPSPTPPIADEDGAQAPDRTPGEAAFAQPETIEEFIVSAQGVYTSLASNGLESSRIMTYALLGWRETVRPSSTRSLLEPAPAPSSSADDETQAVLAAGRIFAALMKSEGVDAAVDAWEGTLEPRTESIVEAVVQMAAADGFDAVADDDVPVFAGEYAWRPLASEYVRMLPGARAVRPIFLDAGDCAVPPPSYDGFDAHRTSLAAMSPPAEQQALLYPLEYGLVYTNIEGKLSDMMPFMYDALLVTWFYNWQYGVVSPLDTLPLNEDAGRWNAPVYPFWPLVASAAFETFAAGNNHYPAALSDAAELARSRDELDITSALGALSSPFYVWPEAAEASRRLGTCMAERALAFLAQTP